MNIPEQYQKIELKKHESGHLLIAVTIMHLTPMCIVDTGANKSCFSEKLARHLKLPINEAANANVGQLLVNNSFKGFVNTDISIANKTIRNIDVGIIGNFEQKFLVQGIIGLDILTELNAIIDTYQATMYIVK